MNCSKCGCTLANENAKRSHERVCDGESGRSKVEQLLEDFDEDADYLSDGGIYVIKILYDDKKYYHVGSTVCLRQRLLDHAHDQVYVYIPTEDNSIKVNDYELIEIIDLEPVNGEKSARKKRAQERVQELAIETGRTDILGGR